MTREEKISASLRAHHAARREANHQLERPATRRGFALGLKAIKRLNRTEEPEAPELLAELAANRPATRADCAAGERPCPYLSCRYHLALDVDPATGSIKLNFPDLELHELAETCALDVADRQGVTLEHVGSLMNVTRERVRQMETAALARIARTVEAA